jgi:hypothetical protein
MTDDRINQQADSEEYEWERREMELMKQPGVIINPANYGKCQMDIMLD